MAVSRSRGRGDSVAAKPGSDAYTGLLGISLLAMIAGTIFLYLDYSQYSSKKPDLPPAPTAIKPATPAPAQPGK
jgi:hypothetical protein